MKHYLFFLLSLLMCGIVSAQTIRISTSKTDLVFRVGGDGRLYQSYLGSRLGGNGDLDHLAAGPEAYVTHGM